jgi:cardiolipin synthase
MAYFAPEKDILSAVCRALDRGVSVRILIPGNANFMQASNMYTVSKLLDQKSGGKPSVFLTDYMLHAKLLMNEKHILTGSCNITQKSFNKLGELCIRADNGDTPFAREVHASVEDLFRNHAHAIRRDEIRFNPLMAAAEAIFMR